MLDSKTALGAARERESDWLSNIRCIVPSLFLLSQAYLVKKQVKNMYFIAIKWCNICAYKLADSETFYIVTIVALGINRVTT